jgi:hypothetical protein
MFWKYMLSFIITSVKHIWIHSSVFHAQLQVGVGLHLEKKKRWRLAPTRLRPPLHLRWGRWIRCLPLQRAAGLELYILSILWWWRSTPSTLTGDGEDGTPPLCAEGSGTRAMGAKRFVWQRFLECAFCFLVVM